MKIIVLAFILLLPATFRASALPAPALQDTIVIGKGKEDSTTFITKSKKGTIVRIELSGAFGGSGYQWVNLTKLTTTCPALTLHDSLREAEPILIGAPEKQVYFYRVKGRKGSVKLNFVLQRPWEKDKAPSQRFTHTVIVTKN